MGKIKNLKIDYKRVKRNLRKEIRRSFMICRLNSVVFKIGRFIQNIKYNDTQKVNKMYYDFNRVNLINKYYLNFIRENLLNQTSFEDLLIIASMLDNYNDCNIDIMSSYNEKFIKLIENKGYSSDKVTSELTKILEKNKYFSKSNEI